MKKKQKVQDPIVADSANDKDSDSIIRSHVQFFDRLIELIPSKFYLPNDDEPKPWYQGLSKAAKASLKQQSKANVKLSRRRRFDPENARPGSDLNELVVEEGNRVNVEDKKESSSVTYEELRQKLRMRIEVMRGSRGGDGGSRADKGNVKDEGKKRKRVGENTGGAGEKGVELEEHEDDEEIIEYGNVRLSDEEGGKRRKKKGKLSKAKELERAQRLQEVKREKPGIVDRESWKAAASRAMGVKVHDDARLIKASMKREKRKKEKNAEKWKERVESQEKMKEQRQQKRKENIVGRIEEKKMRKIAKREKKLMRPGFEGRKEGYITQD